MIPVLNQEVASNLQHVQDLILSEVNVKELELLKDSGMLVKSIKPNFKTIGPKYGKQMKAIADLVKGFSADDIATIESKGDWQGDIDGTTVTLDLADFEIQAQDIPGWLVASENGLTVALDITISESLWSEGIAREMVNRIQNIRKESGLDVTDRILVQVDTNEKLQEAIQKNKSYICTEILGNDLVFVALDNQAISTDIENEGDTKIRIQKN